MIKVAPIAFTTRSCIVSRRDFCSPVDRIKSRENSNSSQSVARDRVNVKIRIAARVLFELILFVLISTWTRVRPVKPRTREAVNEIKTLHQIWPEKYPLSSPKSRRP